MSHHRIPAIALLTLMGGIFTSTANADFVASGPTDVGNGTFAMPRFDLVDNTADQIFSTAVDLDMWFFQLRVSETANQPRLGMQIDFYVDDMGINGVIEPGVDTLIGSFLDPEFNTNSPATTLYEWKLDVTSANANDDLLGVVIASGTAVTNGLGQQNGPERIAFSATSAIPEPSAFLYGGVVAAIAGLGYRRRQKSVA